MAKLTGRLLRGKQARSKDCIRLDTVPCIPTKSRLPRDWTDKGAAGMCGFALDGFRRLVIIAH